jgi:hypothetical protein
MRKGRLKSCITVLGHLKRAKEDTGVDVTMPRMHAAFQDSKVISTLSKKSMPQAETAM